MRFTSSSIAIFGSCARGDTDGFSDKDLLIVESDPLKRAALDRYYTSQGWSCSSYSWARLEKLKAEGALFVQHLRDEAVIVSDPDDRLRHILAMFTPCAAYSRTKYEALSLLELVYELPRTAHGMLWAMDVITVAFRAAAVAELADEGIFRFSYAEIISEFARVRGIKQAALDPIFVARKYKAAHRSARYSAMPRENSVIAALGAADDAFQLGGHCVFVAPGDFSFSSCPDALASHWYSQSRKLELVARTIASGRSTYSESDQDLIATCYGRLTKPVEYGGWLKGNLTELRNQLKRLWDAIDWHKPIPSAQQSPSNILLNLTLDRFLPSLPLRSSPSSAG